MRERGKGASEVEACPGRVGESDFMATDASCKTAVVVDRPGSCPGPRLSSS